MYWVRHVKLLYDLAMKCRDKLAQQEAHANVLGSPEAIPSLQLNFTQQLDMSDSDDAALNEASSPIQPGDPIASPLLLLHETGCIIAQTYMLCAGAQVTQSHSELVPAHPQAASMIDLVQPARLAESTSAQKDTPSTHSRGLGGFLTPLGRLGGMLRWAPGKVNEQSTPQHSSTAGLSFQTSASNARHQLHQLARPANAAEGHVQLSRADMLQIRPEQLTADQLRNLQKAAELLSPKSSVQHQVSRSAVPCDKAHQVSLQSAANLGQAELQSQVYSHGQDPAALHGQETHVMQQPEQIAAQLPADTASQENDMLAAALASKLTSMAPCLSSLHRGPLQDRPSVCTTQKAGQLGVDTQQGSIHGRQKRSRPEDVQDSSISSIDGVASPLPSTSSAGCAKAESNSGIDNKSVASSVAFTKRGQQNDGISQQVRCQALLQPRKRFRRWTGIEVLHHYMPSLRQDAKGVTA